MALSLFLSLSLSLSPSLPLSLSLYLSLSNEAYIVAGSLTGAAILLATAIVALLFRRRFCLSSLRLVATPSGVLRNFWRRLFSFGVFSVEFPASTRPRCRGGSERDVRIVLL